MLNKANESTKQTIQKAIMDYESSVNAHTMKDQFIKLALKTKRQGMDNLLTVLDAHNEEGLNFFNQPASAGHHSNSLGGLLKHSLMVYDNLQYLIEKSIGCIEIDANSMIIAALFHDLCKWNSYEFNITDKKGEWSNTPFKYNNNTPLGHGEQSVIVLQNYIPLTKIEAGMIRWHMGPFDRAYFENSKALQKHYPQSEYLFLADMWASRLEGAEEDE